MNDDKRASKRAPIVLRIKLRYDSVESFVQKFATNLSPGGMFISSRAPKPVGSKLRFELRIADDSPVVSGTGTVKWVEPYDADRPRALHGMGIEFDRLSGQSRALIHRVVQHQREQGLETSNEIPMTAQRPGYQPPPPEPEAEADVTGADDDTAPAPRQVLEDVAGNRDEDDTAPAPRQRPADRGPTPRLVTSATVDDLDDLDAGEPNMSRWLSRARELAAGATTDDDELDALLAPPTAPRATLADATAGLTRLGDVDAPAGDPESGDPDASATAKPEPERALAAVGSGPAHAVGPEPEVTTSAPRPPNMPPPIPMKRTQPPRLASGTPAPVLDAADSFEVSSSGSIDLSALADDVFAPSDSLSHDLDADALDAEGLLASGVDQLATPNRGVSMAPLHLPDDAPDLASFADPPSDMGLDDPPPRSEFDPDVNALVTRTDSPQDAPAGDDLAIDIDIDDFGDARASSDDS